MTAFIDYSKLIENAMRIVAKNALSFMAENYENIGEHHFYISFLTNAHGVVLSERMKKRYPHEMTIVLQYEFEDLEVKEDYFTVKIGFAGIKEKVKVPFFAITSFADPSVQFVLQFTESYTETTFSYGNPSLSHLDINELNNQRDIEDKDAQDLPSNVIPIDKFMKKRTK